MTRSCCSSTSPRSASTSRAANSCSITSAAMREQGLRPCGQPILSTRWARTPMSSSSISAASSPMGRRPKCWRPAASARSAKPSTRWSGAGRRRHDGCRHHRATAPAARWRPGSFTTSAACKESSGASGCASSASAGGSSPLWCGAGLARHLCRRLPLHSRHLDRAALRDLYPYEVYVVPGWR